jgi:flagellar protein FlaJ
MPELPQDPAPPNTEKRQIPFAGMVAGFKLRIAQVTEDRKMGADLLFTTTYMASLALANASRPELFAYAANRKEYISSKYITRVDTYVNGGIVMPRG